MNIEYIDSDNYESVLAFLNEEKQNISDWLSALNDGLFKICVINENNEIECVFIFEDYPRSIENKYEYISKSNWTNWLKNYFEITNETYHMLWLTKWYTTTSRKFDVDLLKLVLSSLFISNFEIESILLSVDTDKNDENESEKSFNFAFQMLFHPLHRIHRNINNTDNNNNNNNNNNDDDKSLLNKVDLFYCPSCKLLPNIEIRNATVEDFDDLMPLFQENSSYLQQKHGEFFLAELIESAQNDKRLQTLVAISNDKPVGFVCFTTNIDLMSLRNSFYLQQFDDFEKVDFPMESKKFNKKIQLKREKSNKIYEIDTLFTICQSDTEIAEMISGHIMKYYSKKEWVIEQEELLKQSPDDDANYMEFIKLSFNLLEESRAIELEKYLNQKVIEYKKEHPNKDIDHELNQINQAQQQLNNNNNNNNNDNTQKPSTLTIDTSLSPLSISRPGTGYNNDQKDTMVVVINLLCIDSNYIYATKVFAQSIFNYYPKCQYLLSTTIHDQPTPNYLNYFSRVYAKPCIEYPYNLYLLDKNAINATISIRLIDWKLDIEQLKQMINISVPNRDRYLTNPNNDDLTETNIYHCYVVVVDYKIVGAVYISNITKKEISEFNTLYDLSSIITNINNLNTMNTAKLEFMILNPIFNINIKGILKEVMRQIQIDILFYNYINNNNNDNNNDKIPDPQSCVIENFVQLKPKQFVYSTNASNQSTYALYTFYRGFYAESQEIINHRIVIIGNNDDGSYGFIEYMMTQKDLKFTNITLINASSSNTNNDDEKIKFIQNLNDIKKNTLLFKSNIVSDIKNGNYLQKLCIDNKIEIINDNISELDITKKCIYLKDSGICSYDILIFANGLGPVHIIPQIKYLSKDGKTNKRITFSQLLEETMEYKNVLLVSPEIEDDIKNLEIYIKNNNNLLNGDENIIIYGENINIFCIINYLITKYNINGNRIIMINCLSSTSSEFYFKNNKLKLMLEKQLKDLGVRILENVIPVGFIRNKYNRYLIDAIQCIQSSENKEINAMIINEKDEEEEEYNEELQNDAISPHVIKLKLSDDSHSGLPYYSLSAQLVILCQNEIDIDTLHITNQNPFVIDGKIVIDNQFKTRDPTIYAIGSIAKFSRKFVNNNNNYLSSLQYANSFDIGRQSAALIANNILNEDVNTNSNGKEFKINIEKETCVVAKLHGGYHYFYAYNPQFVISKVDNIKNAKYFESYNENQLSLIIFDSFGYLREILYYGIEWKPEWIKCANLININSAFLNDIENDFKETKENNFVNICEIFNKQQYQIMCDDRFKNWMQTVNKSNNIDKNQIKNDIQSLITRIVKGNEE